MHCSGKNTFMQIINCKINQTLEVCIKITPRHRKSFRVSRQNRRALTRDAFYALDADAPAVKRDGPSGAFGPNSAKCKTLQDVSKTKHVWLTPDDGASMIPCNALRTNAVNCEG